MGNDLKSPRIIGNAAFDKPFYKNLPNRIANQLSLHYLQLVAHDVGLRVPRQNGIQNYNKRPK